MNHLGLTVFAGNTPGLILDFDQATKQYTIEFVDGRIVKSATVYWDNNVSADPETAMYRRATIGNGEQLVYDPPTGWDVSSDEDSDEDPTAQDEDECEECGGQGQDDDDELCYHCDGKGYMSIQKVAASPMQMQIVKEPSDLGEWVDEHRDESGDHTPKGEYGPDPGASTMGDPDLSKHNDTDTKIEALEDKVDKILDLLENQDGNNDEEEINPEGIQDADHDATEESYWDRQTKPKPGSLDEQFPSGSHSERYPGPLNPTAATKKKHDPSAAIDKVKRVPPAGVIAAAKRGLKYYEDGKAGEGFDDAIADRARRIAAGEKLTPDHINRMHSFFERHAGGRSKTAKPGDLTSWDVAWLCWGGDPGRSWVAKVDSQLERAAHPKAKKKKTADAGGAGVFTPERTEPEEQWLRSTLDEQGGDDVFGANEVAKGLGDSDIAADRRGNPEMRTTDGDVFFPEMPLDIVRPVMDSRKDIKVDNKDAWKRALELDDTDIHHSHVREESDWTDAHYANGPECTTCRDPLVNGMCHNCGEDRSEDVKKNLDNQERIAKIVEDLRPHASELGTLFGNAFAGTRKSVTEQSEDTFAVHLHGQDSDPSIGGTGGYNLQHGDSPELLKDVVDEGNAMFIDATPETMEEGLRAILEHANSDKSAKDNENAVSLGEFLDEALGSDFKNSKRLSYDAMTGIPGSLGYEGGDSVTNAPTTQPGPQVNTQDSVNPNDNFCKACNQSFVSGVCNKTSNPSVEPPTGCEARPEGQTRQYSAAVDDLETPDEMPDDFLEEAPDEEGVDSGKITDIDGNTLEEGQLYDLYSGVGEDAPEKIIVEEVTPSGVIVDRINSPFPSQEITWDQFDAEGLRFHPKEDNKVHPNEMGMDSEPDALDGTPETMDDAGPGQNDIPGERNLGNKVTHTKESRRDYLPNQQREFINEPGKARNLDKLVLEGTHYVDGEITSSENFDDNFLFGF